MRDQATTLKLLPGLTKYFSSWLSGASWNMQTALWSIAAP